MSQIIDYDVVVSGVKPHWQTKVDSIVFLASDEYILKAAARSPRIRGAKVLWVSDLENARKFQTPHDALYWIDEWKKRVEAFATARPDATNWKAHAVFRETVGFTAVRKQSADTYW